jgi:hypothetical protein
LPVPAPDCRLGIDVGGTNTDAVIMDAADRVIAKAKVPRSSTAASSSTGATCPRWTPTRSPGSSAGSEVPPRAS